jgi:hypothetical protein
MTREADATPETPAVTLPLAEALRRALRALAENRLDARGPRTFYELAALAKINRVQFSKRPLRGVARELVALLAAGKREEATTHAKKHGRRRRAPGFPRRRAS